MVKLQGNNCNKNTNHVVDPELQRLFDKRAKSKDQVDVDIQFITPMLVAGLEDSAGLVDHAIEAMETHMEDLKLAHRKYIKNILENPVGTRRR